MTKKMDLNLKKNPFISLINLFNQKKSTTYLARLRKKRSFPLKISPVIVIISEVSSEFDYIR